MLAGLELVVCVYIYTHTHICIHIYVYIHICIYTQVYIYIYMYIYLTDLKLTGILLPLPTKCWQHKVMPPLAPSLAFDGDLDVSDPQASRVPSRSPKK